MKKNITDARKFEKGTLRGFFTFHLGDFSIRDWTYHEKNSKFWVNPPQKQYRDENGEIKYSPIVFIEDADRYRAFQKWATAECGKLFSFTSEPERSGTPF